MQLYSKFIEQFGQTNQSWQKFIEQVQEKKLENFFWIFSFLQVKLEGMFFFKKKQFIHLFKHTSVLVEIQLIKTTTKFYLFALSEPTGDLELKTWKRPLIKTVSLSHILMCTHLKAEYAQAKNAKAQRHPQN